jgi:hypothetical protein
MRSIHEPTGRQAAEVVVALDQHRVGAEPGRSVSGRRARRPAADDKYLAVAIDRDLACGFDHLAEVGARAAAGVAFEDVGREDALVGAGQRLHGRE